MFKPKQTKFRQRMAMAFISLSAAGGVCAQESGSQPIVQAQEKNVENLSTVVVTAQKRPQVMQQVPAAMSVVSSQEIENRGVSGFAELLTSIPNTTIDQNTSTQPSISIRGISSSVNNIGMESGVGVVVDDVFLGRPSAFSTQLIDIDRVEVLRGSQGTLFGKNTTGGLINIVTAKPTRALSGAFDFSGGSFGLQQARGYLTGEVSDSIAGKVSFTSKKRDGWVKNRNPDGADLMSENFEGVRGQLLGKPNTATTWLLTADYSKENAVDNYYDIRDGAFTAFDSDAADRSIYTNGNDGFYRTIQGLSLKVDWKSSGVDWTSITAQRGVDWSGRNDQDYTLLPLLVLGRNEKQTQLSQEVRASGTSGKLNWLGGVFLFKQEQDGIDTMRLDEGAPPIFGLPNTPGFQESADTIVQLASESVAGFGTLNYGISSVMDLNVGLRYTKERKEMNYRQHLNQSVGLISALAAEVAPFTGSRTDSQWSGDLGVAFKHSKNINSYLKVTKGFKAGGFNTTSASSSDAGDLSFDPESVVNYEAGLKTILADGSVRLNTAIFKMDYANKQEQFFDGVHQIVSNAAKAKVSGIEIDLTAKVLPGLQIGASAGYQEATYTDYLNFAGNSLVDAPRVTGSLNAQYTHNLTSGWNWMARADARYKGMTYQQPDNDERFTQPASTILDLSFGLRSDDGRYSILLWVKNATDRTYRVSTYGIDAFQTLYQSVNVPRMTGLEFRVNL